MLKALDKSDREEWNKEVEDCWRLGKYSKGESRPLKIRLKSTKAAEEILSNSWKLSEDERYSKVIIRKDLNVEERNTMREVNREVKEKNENRTEAEKANFYYRNMDGNIRKWFLRKGQVVSMMKGQGGQSIGSEGNQQEENGKENMTQTEEKREKNSLEEEGKK